MCLEVQDVFDLFDFWDGRDSMVDGVKVGDFLRCCGLNPTQALVLANGGTANVGESLACWISSNTTPLTPLYVKWSRLIGPLWRFLTFSYS